MAPRRTLHHRALALTLALILTLGPLLALRFHTFASGETTSTQRISYLSLHLPPPDTKGGKQESGEARPRLKVDSSENRQPAASPFQASLASPDSSPAQTIQRVSEAQASVAEAPDLPASAPIKLDLATIRAANQASKSEVRRMAEVSGTYIGDDPISESKKLAGEIARTAKEDCLSPNAGGSLLSIFVIPYMALRGKCK